MLSGLPVVELAWALRALGREADFAAAREKAMPAAWVDAAAAVAEGRLMQAAELLARIGAHTEEARARLGAAEQLIRAGRRPEANKQLDAALTFFRSLGATWYVRQGEALLAESA